MRDLAIPPRGAACRPSPPAFSRSVGGHPARAEATPFRPTDGRDEDPRPLLELDSPDASARRSLASCATPMASHSGCFLIGALLRGTTDWRDRSSNGAAGDWPMAADFSPSGLDPMITTTGARFRRRDSVRRPQPGGQRRRSDRDPATHRRGCHRDRLDRRDPGAGLREHPLVESLHLAEIDPARLERVAKATGARTATQDYHELLGRKDLDAVFVSATPETTHYPITRDCLIARKHTLPREAHGAGAQGSRRDDGPGPRGRASSSRSATPSASTRSTPTSGSPWPTAPSAASSPRW